MLCCVCKASQSTRKQTFEALHIVDTIGSYLSSYSYVSVSEQNMCAQKRCVENVKLRRVHANHSEGFEALHVVDTNDR